MSRPGRDSTYTQYTYCTQYITVRASTARLTHTHTHACASMRGRAMLDPVPHSTSRTVDQTPPSEREGAGAFTVWAYASWSAPRGWLSKWIIYDMTYSQYELVNWKEYELVN